MSSGSKVENMGYAGFSQRSVVRKKEILDNYEKYMMAELKPIDNLDIDMDFKFPWEEEPYINTEYGADFRVSLRGRGFLIITDSYSQPFDDICLGVRYAEHQEKISNSIAMEILDWGEQTKVLTLEEVRGKEEDTKCKKY